VFGRAEEYARVRSTAEQPWESSDPCLFEGDGQRRVVQGRRDAYTAFRILLTKPDHLHGSVRRVNVDVRDYAKRRAVERVRQRAVAFLYVFRARNSRSSHVTVSQHMTIGDSPVLCLLFALEAAACRSFGRGEGYTSCWRL
jgi:hypothetical protein